MITRKLTRLRRLTLREAAVRSRALTDVVGGRLQTALHRPAWRRGDLVGRIAPGQQFRALADDLAAGRWMTAHQRLAGYFAAAPPRFPIAPVLRPALSAEITRRFPDAPRHAAQVGDRLLSGRYDLLGYTGVEFDGRHWSLDPVHQRSAPSRYWSSVPYLDPACGDHKVIWELNRHQHWIALGRAYWLTGDARYRDLCVRQLQSWMADNPPLIGVNWASMLELGFRGLSWLWAVNFFAGPEDEHPWLVDLLLALDRQLTHIERHLSYYFSPNTHLLGEALALYVCGLALPMLEASAQRVAVGRRILVDELGRQVAADGGHCERSTHYLRYTLDFYLLAAVVARLTGDQAAGTFTDAVQRLANATRTLADDRGWLPQWGDDDGGSLLPIAGRAPADVSDSLAQAAAITGQPDLSPGKPPEELWWLLGARTFTADRDRLETVARRRRPRPPSSAALPDTGYYVSRTAAGDHMVIDGGHHGYLNGGHAHADALALTLTWRGTPLLIDPGTATYTMDAALRDRFRSSQSHNTLTLDDRSPSVPRGPFHWQRSVDAATHCWRAHPRIDYFAGSHDGYAPLVHARHVLSLHDDMVVVADGVIGAGAPAAAVHWHLDPRWHAQVNDASARLHDAASGTDVDLVTSGGTVDCYRADTGTGLGWRSPAYGRIEAATTVRLAAAALTAPGWLISVFSGTRNRVRAVTPIASCAAGTLSPRWCIGIRIEREDGVDVVVFSEPPPAASPAAWQFAGIHSDARMVHLRETADGRLVSAAAIDARVFDAPAHPALALPPLGGAATPFIEWTPPARPGLDTPLTSRPGTMHAPAVSRSY